MPALRKLGPYVACLICGVVSGVGLAYLLYIRLHQELAEIRKRLGELKQEIDIYAETDRPRSRRNHDSRGSNKAQVMVTASSGDDDDDFVDCVAGLSDNDTAESQGDPELVKFVRWEGVGIEESFQSPTTAPEERNGEVPVSNLTGDGQLSPAREVSHFMEDFFLSEQTDEKDPTAETEKRESVP